MMTFFRPFHRIKKEKSWLLQLTYVPVSMATRAIKWISLMKLPNASNFRDNLHGNGILFLQTKVNFHLSTPYWISKLKISTIYDMPCQRVIDFFVVTYNRSYISETDWWTFFQNVIRTLIFRLKKCIV